MTRPTPPRIEVPNDPPDPSAAPLTLQEQLAQIGDQMLASAQRLATDPEALKATQKLLF
jgi:hypothetical protein